MIHGSITKGLFTNKGSVLTSGGAGRLAKGQLAIVTEKSGVGGANVLAASDFAGLPRNQKLKIRVGRSPLPQGTRSQFPTKYETNYFTPQDIVSITANFPKYQKQTFDEVVIGYDGINASSAINIPEGKSSVIDFTLAGKAIEIFGGVPMHNFKFNVGREIGQTTQEVVRKLAATIKEANVPRSQKNITEFVDVSVIDSTNSPLTGTASVFSTLTVVDAGDSNALALVQAQYVAYTVTRTSREDGSSVYTVLRPQASVLANFSLSKIKAYTKGCANCLPTYTSIVGGVVYHITLEDNGVTQVAVVQALPGAVAASASKIGQIDGRGVYSVVLTTALTSAQITAFVATSAITASAEVKKLGTTETVCESATSTSTAWVDGQVCRTKAQTYTLQLKDNECGATRLAEVQAAYPTLTVIEASPAQVGGCSRVYSTTVTTNIVCSECSDIFLQPFTSVAPKNFEDATWKEVVPAFDAAALMGIRIKGKSFNIMPSEEARDMIPFYETSTRILNVSGGYRQMDFLNFVPEYKYDEMFKVNFTSRAQDRDALGAMLLPVEEVSRTHFLGEQREFGNLFARTNLGEESLVRLDGQYISYSISWRDSGLSQGGGGRSDITHTEQVFVEFGYHDAIEALVNALAVKAGVETVNPTAN